jgi:DNA topoisomerase-1
MVTLRIGPYGPYVQLGGTEPPPPPPPAEAEAEAEPGGKKKRKPKAPKAPKPKRASLPKGTDPHTVDLERALKLLSLPREIGVEPESGEMITAGIGRFGPYLKVGTRYQSLPKDDDILEIGLNRAIVVLAEGKNKQGRRGGAAAGKILGQHPAGGAITLRKGRFGPYVQYGKISATLPRDMDSENVSLEAAVSLIAAKEAKNGTTPAKGRGGRSRKSAGA